MISMTYDAYSAATFRSTYRALVGAFEAVMADFSPPEAARLLSANAERVHCI